VPTTCPTRGFAVAAVHGDPGTGRPRAGDARVPLPRRSTCWSPPSGGPGHRVTGVPHVVNYQDRRTRRTTSTGSAAPDGGGGGGGGPGARASRSPWWTGRDPRWKMISDDSGWTARSRSRPTPPPDHMFRRARHPTRPAAPAPSESHPGRAERRVHRGDDGPRGGVGRQRRQSGVEAGRHRPQSGGGGTAARPAPTRPPRRAAPHPRGRPPGAASAPLPASTSARGGPNRCRPPAGPPRSRTAPTHWGPTAGQTGGQNGGPERRVNELASAGRPGAPAPAEAQPPLRRFGVLGGDAPDAAAVNTASNTALVRRCRCHSPPPGALPASRARPGCHKPKGSTDRARAERRRRRPGGRRPVLVVVLALDRRWCG